MSCRRSKSVALILATCGLLFSAPGLAQVAPAPPRASAPPSRPAAKRAGGNYLAVPGYWVLGMTGVQKDVGLTDEQKQQLQDISSRYQSWMQKNYEAVQNLAPEEQERRMEALRPQADRQMQSARKQVEAVLSPQQLKAAQQIAFSMQAASMLGNEKLREQIGLNQVQQQQIDRLYDQMRESMEQLQRTMAAKVMEILTPEQQAALRKEAARAPQGP